MGLRQSKPIVYAVMCKDPRGKNHTLAVFSTLKKAKDHAPQLQYGGPIWIERFKVDSPGFYENDDEAIVWRMYADLDPQGIIPGFYTES
jgi:hypothetical protein